MTTLAEERAKRLQDLKDTPGLITAIRLKVIEAVELANDMKERYGKGLNDPYDIMTRFYGKQRAILRGLTETDIMSFVLPDTETWNTDTGFTFPSVTQFGYEFYDQNGNLSIIDNPDLYYLAKKKEDDSLATLQDDTNAFVSPVVLPSHETVLGMGNNIETDFEFTLKTATVPGTMRILVDGLEIAQDDGEGNITDTGISGTIDYNTRSLNLSFAEAIEHLKGISAVFDSYTNESGFTDHYEQIDFTLDPPKSYGPGLTLNLINVAADVLQVRPQLLSTMVLRKKLDHQSVGLIQITCEGLNVNPGWDHLLGDPEDATLLNHSEFRNLLGYLNPLIDNDLMKSANSYITSNGRKEGGKYLDIEASPFFPCTDGTYTGSPAFKGHFVHTEEGVDKWGVHSDIKWQYGTTPKYEKDVEQNNPETILKALNAIANFNGGISTIPLPTASLTYSMSGEYVYATPWTGSPSTPGTASRVACYTNDVQALADQHLHFLLDQCDLMINFNFENSIDNDRNQVDADFKSDTETFRDALEILINDHNGFIPLGDPRPTYNTAQMTILKTAAEIYLSVFNERIADLDSVIGSPTGGPALDTLNRFSSTQPIVLPDDVIDALTYAMNGEYVFQTTHPDNTSEEFDCYTNDVQHLKDSYLNHLLNQCNIIIGLEEIPIDFATNTTTFRDALNTFMAYHESFSPLSRDPYETEQMTTLMAAAAIYSNSLTRVIGFPTTGGYSKTIYDSCNIAVHKSIGYVREVTDKLNSIQDIYYLIKNQQEEYIMYQ